MHNKVKPQGRPKDSKKTLLRLWSYLYQYRWMVMLALLLTLFSNLLALIGPMLSGYAIDAIGLGKGQVQFIQRVVCYT